MKYEDEQLLIDSSHTVLDDEATKTNSINNERINVTKVETVPVHYARRWYILILYSWVGFLANLIWNTWGPIAESAEKAFGWTDGDIALLGNYGPITFLISALFLAWLMDKKGLKFMYLFSS